MDGHLLVGGQNDPHIVARIDIRLADAAIASGSLGDEPAGPPDPCGQHRHGQHRGQRPQPFFSGFLFRDRLRFRRGVVGVGLCAAGNGTGHIVVVIQLQRMIFPCGPEEHLLHLTDALEPVLRPDGHSLFQYRFLQGADLYPQFGGPLQFIQLGPFQGVVRLQTGDTAVDGGAQRVDVGPRPLMAFAAVLLLRGKARLEDHRHAGVAAEVQLSGGSEVHQFDGAALQQHDVVRADIPVNDAHLVDLFQRVHDGPHPFKDIVGRKAGQSQDGAQVMSVQVLHDDIGGVVGFKKVPDRNHARVICKLRQCPGLAEKFLFSFLDGIHLSLIRDGDLRGKSHVSAGDPTGVIFLDGYPGIQQQIPANVGNAESTLTQRTPDQISAVQFAAGAKVVEQLRIPALISAVGTHIRSAGGQHTV